MDALLIEQRATIRLIENAVANYEKLAMPKRTAAVAEGRLKLLLDHWAVCQQLNVKINIAAGQKLEGSYFEKDEFAAAEEAFETAHDFLQEKVASFRPQALPAANSTLLGNSSATEGTNSMTPTKLPPIDLPKFSGCYTEWTNYKSMFETLIIQRAALSNVQRLHYLKSTLSGEASRLVQHFAVDEASFQTAWDLLTETYEDQRAIIDAHFKNFLSLPAMAAESPKDLKNLRDKTRESLRALKLLGSPTDQWDHIIVYLTVQKLDSSSEREWEMQLGTTSEYPTLKALTDFLSARIRALEKTSGSNKPPNRSNAKTKTSPPASEVRSYSTTAEAAPTACLMCDEKHPLYKCEQYKSQTLARRKELARDKKCCYNCLRPGHLPRACPSKYTCSRCKKKHHTLLHAEANSEAATSSTSAALPDPVVVTGPTQGPSSTSTHHAQLAPAGGQFTLLATAMVNLRTATGRRIRVRALLDQGSQTTLIKESIVQALRPKRFPANTVVHGVGEVEIGTAKHRVNVYAESCSKEEDFVTISALVLPTLARYTPRSRAPMKSWDHLSGITLADPQPSSQEPIALIIGADYYGGLLRPGLRQGPMGAPTAQATMFGWILSGPDSSTSEPPGTVAVHNCSTSEDLHTALARFWEIEELPRVTRLSEEEEKCEEHFAATHRRAEDGRYIVRLPFKAGPPIDIGESFFRATSMLHTVERRLQRDPALHAEYNAFLAEYEALGHMRAAPPSIGNSRDEATSQCVYLPHHPVVRDSRSRCV